MILFWVFTFAIGIAWDWYAITREHWVYQNVLGFFVFGIPIEDFFFIFVVAYIFLVAYRLFRHKKWFYI